MFQYQGMICALLSMTLLTGCAPETPDKRKEAKATLRFWHIMNYSGPREVLADAVTRFQKKHPDVRVDVETFSNDDYKTKLALEMASGNEPDVFFCWGAGGQTGRYIDQERVVDMTPYATKNGWNGRFLNAALELCRRKDRLYCAPLDLSAVVIWCNRSLFARYDVQMPKTWKEFQDACEAFKRRGVTPLALGNLDAWPGAFYFCYLANRLGGTQLFWDAAAGVHGRNFAHETFVTAGTMLQNMREYFNADFAERREDEARKMFVRGRSPMYLGGSWLVGQLVANPEARTFLKQLEPLKFPVIPTGKGDPNTLLGGVNCAFAVAQASQQKALALELVDELTSGTTARDWCRIGRIPAVQTQPEWRQAFPEASQKVYGLLVASTGLQPYYDQYLEATATVVHKNTTRDLLKGRLTGKQAAERMNQAMQR